MAGLLFILAVSSTIALAGDEDMLSPYAEFDPETGFFLGPDGQIAEPGAQGMQPADTPTATPAKANATSVPAEQAESPASDSILPLVIPGMVIVVAGIIYGLRRYRRNAG